MKNILIEKINQSLWWHVPPKNPNAYKKRGRFLASTYLQAEFYGRPNIEPERVTIKNPVFGFSENEILKRLFNPAELSSIGNMENIESNFYKKRIALDAKMCRKARILGYDSIVLMTLQGEKALQRGRKPNSIELNLLFNKGKDF